MPTSASVTPPRYVEELAETIPGAEADHGTAGTIDHGDG